MFVFDGDAKQQPMCYISQKVIGSDPLKETAATLRQANIQTFSDRCK